MNYRICKKKYALFVLLILSGVVFAGPIDPPIEEDPIEPVPINQFLWLNILIALAIAFYKLYYSGRRTEKINE